jgi:hypothetical protein
VSRNLGSQAEALVARTTAEQGLPYEIADPQVLERIATILCSGDGDSTNRLGRRPYVAPAGEPTHVDMAVAS